jgi:hypothetical protein
VSAFWLLLPLKSWKCVEAGTETQAGTMDRRSHSSQLLYQETFLGAITYGMLPKGNISNIRCLEIFILRAVSVLKLSDKIKEATKNCI